MELSTCARFLYCRYNHEFQTQDSAQLDADLRASAMDDLRLIPFYEEMGETFTQKSVQAGHLLA